MNEKKSSALVASVALAAFAGVLGSLFTLLVTSNLRVPVLETPGAVPAIASASFDANQAMPASQDTLNPHLQLSTEEHHEVLYASLKEASDERAQLAQVLAQLTRQIEDLESESINRRSLAELQSLGDETIEQSVQDVPDSDNFGGSSAASDRVRSLVAAGVEYNNALALQQRQDRYQLARLEMFDLAEREGWIDTDEFTTQLEELDRQRLDLREELGDEQYDRYLFEAGRNNRVVIESIIPGSAAELAGLQPRDMVITYAQSRVFSTSDLQQATRAGVRGEIIAIQVERQGQTLFFEATRGPLGITLRADKQSPS